MTNQVTFLFSLGERVRDKVTTFEGIITVQTCHLNGCIRYRVQPSKLDKDGNPLKSFEIDEAQLELIEQTELKVGHSKGFIDYKPIDYLE